MIFLCFILTLVFYATTPAIAMDDDLPVNFHKRKGFNHSEETHLKRTKLTKVLNFGKETQLAKSIKETPISTIAWVMDQYANVFGLKGDQNFCSFKKNNGKPEVLKKTIYQLREFINHKQKNKPIVDQETQNIILYQLNDLAKTIDNYIENRKNNPQTLQAHPMFGYLAQRQMVIPKGLILPYYIAPESIESYIKSMPRSVEKDEYRTIYQTFLHIEPISSGLQEKHSVFIAALKNALPMVWKVSENVIQDLEVLAEKYKDTRSKPFILKFTDQSKVDIKGLFQAINQCSVRIIGLDFSSASAHLNSESIKPLAEELKHNKFITSLDLRWNKDIGVEGAKALAGMLKTNKTLVFLDLGWNFIGVEGARALAEALKTNKSLVFLDLFRNEIGDEGAKSISEALKINTTLTLLDLEFNEIGAQGARALAEVLEMNETFTSLNLFNNPIGSEGIKDITEVLKTNTTLTSLNWGYNKDGDSGSKAIQDMLQINKMIKVTYQCGWSQPCLQYWLFMKWGI